MHAKANDLLKKVNTNYHSPKYSNKDQSQKNRKWVKVYYTFGVTDVAVIDAGPACRIWDSCSRRHLKKIEMICNDRCANKDIYIYLKNQNFLHFSCSKNSER